jgi:adenine deaminase
MNYPGVLAAEPSVLDKMALTGYDRIDGHAPGLTGRDLNAYLVAGPTSDHECTSLAEALEKRRLGMWIMIREASMIRNLLELLPLVQQYGTENCMFVTDDREASTLLSEGHMNAIVRKAVKHGLALGDAVKLASLNVARYHGLPRRGAIAPGYSADIVVLPNAVDIKPDFVYRDGRLVARGGEALPFPSPAVPDDVLNTVHAGTVSAKSFAIPDSGSPNIRVIDLVQDQVITRAGLAKACGANGALRADGARDLAKVAVVERHHETGRVGVAFVRGFGLREGAFASTVAHDAHNIVVVGIDDEDMALCVERLAMLGGGLTVARSGRIVDEMRLEIAGLMSTQPARAVASTLARLELRLCEMGVSIATPFMYLSFLALSVIPELRITDHGLVDVRTFELVPVGVG